MSQDQFTDKIEKRNKLLTVIAVIIGIIILGLAVFVAISFLKLQKTQKLINQKQAQKIEVLDADNDGLPKNLETMLGTDPNSSDSDNDGIFDGREIPQIPEPTVPAKDSDQNSLPDNLEAILGTSPNNLDKTLSEQTTTTESVTAKDSDQDGLPDNLEVVFGTDPNNPDSDGNGISDGEQFKK